MTVVTNMPAAVGAQVQRAAVLASSVAHQRFAVGALGNGGTEALERLGSHLGAVRAHRASQGAAVAGGPVVPALPATSLDGTLTVTAPTQTSAPMPTQMPAQMPTGVLGPNLAAAGAP